MGIIIAVRTTTHARTSSHAKQFDSWSQQWSLRSPRRRRRRCIEIPTPVQREPFSSSVHQIIRPAQREFYAFTAAPQGTQIFVLWVLALSAGAAPEPSLLWRPQIFAADCYYR
jgi:hypothetical protein